MKTPRRIALTACIASLLPLPAVVAQPICCYNCGSGGPARSLAIDRPESPRALARLLGAVPAADERAATAADGGFIGRIDGAWDDVDGYFTLPYPVSGLGTLQVLLRGFPAQALGQGLYSVDGWDRSAYWLDTGDGTPRLLQALELMSDYVPQPGDYFLDSPDVVDTCTTGAGCTLNLVPYLRYQEFGADYSNRGYIEAGVRFDEIQMAFVTDAAGDAIDAAVLFEEDIGTDPIQPFQQGDRIQLSVLAYKMDEPEYIYALGYMGQYAPLLETASISRGNFVPGQDFSDPELPADLNAGARQVHLVLDASSGGGDGYGVGGERPVGNFAYGGPFALGFRWQQAAPHLHSNGFEALAPASRGSKRLVRPQP